MTSGIQPADLGSFPSLAAAGSLSAAARELGVTTPAVSKHLALMESRLGVSLVNRTTRRMSLTPEGELYLSTRAASWARSTTWSSCSACPRPRRRACCG